MSSNRCKSVEFGVRVHNNHRFAGHTNACADDTGSHDESDGVELDGHVCMSASASTVDLHRLDAPLRPVRKIWCELRRKARWCAHQLGLSTSVVLLGIAPGQDLAGSGCLLLRGSKAGSHDRRAENGGGEHGA